MAAQPLFLSFGLGLLLLSSALALDSVDEADEVANDFVTLSMIELEEHESTPTPPFSVCKYLIETTASRIKKEDKWADMVKHIATVRETLPEHVRTACDSFIKENQGDIISLLQLSEDPLTATLENVAAAANAQEESAAASDTSETAETVSDPQGDAFKQFWEEKGQYCGACLTMTKKIQKWLSMNCTQDVITERIMRMCNTMPQDLQSTCNNQKLWVREFVVKELLNKFPLPNHCAYIGLCEKTMVVRALQNPMVMAEQQNALIEDLEGRENLVQEGELSLQRPHETVNTAPEITFDLGSDGGVSYRDVDRATGEDLPKIFMDGTPSENMALLEEQASQWDLSIPDDPKFTVHAQDEDQVHVPIMHASLKQAGNTKVSKTYNFQDNKLPIDDQWLKGCASCQFTIGSLFEFMSNPRTARTILPAVKNACKNCNNAEEVQKCMDFVENHGVAFYQDVVRQGSPAKWCPRLQLCEIQYFYPSPHVLPDSYSNIRERVTAISDF